MSAAVVAVVDGVFFLTVVTVVLTTAPPGFSPENFPPLASMLSFSSRLLARAVRTRCLPFGYRCCHDLIVASASDKAEKPD